MCLLHVSLVPVVGAVGEHKTKPTQASVRELRALGLTPDIVVCRSTHPLATDTKHKISLFTHVKPENVVGVHDVSNIYKVCNSHPCIYYLPSLLINLRYPFCCNNKDFPIWFSQNYNWQIQTQCPLRLALKTYPFGLPSGTR